MSAEQEKMSPEDEASAAFLGPLQGEWTAADQQQLEARLGADPAYADAYRRLEKVWAALDKHADSPQLLARRQEAIAYARQANRRRLLNASRYLHMRWHAAAVAAITIALAAAWQISPYGYRPGLLHTGIGEQRIVELDDHSRIELDADTVVRVRYSDDARTVELKRGQARFSVAADATRPFKVQVGNHTIVALGTVFTVDLLNQKIHVTMMEGRVAVVPRFSANHAAAPAATAHSEERAELPSSSAVRGAIPTDAIELSAGEELRVGQDGRARLTAQADLEAATAWREGKIIFRNQALGEAVQRLSRYSRVQVEIADEVLAAEQISGVFDAGDTQGFVRDLQRYLPVVADTQDSERIRLRLK